MKIIINAIPPSLNKFAGRQNHWEYRRLKEQWKNMIFLAAKNETVKTHNKAIVTISYYFKDRMRRDPDNFSGKMIMDGLTAAGVILDDSFDCIELRLRGGYDKENPRTEIEITEGELK